VLTINVFVRIAEQCGLPVRRARFRPPKEDSLKLRGGLASAVSYPAADLTAAALLKDPPSRASRAGVGLGPRGGGDQGHHRRGRAGARSLHRTLPALLTSRGEADFQDKLLSAMRYEFGGHLEKI